MFKNLLFFIITIFIMVSCKPEIQNKDYNFEGKGILICNEGNFTYGNASLSYIDLESDSIYSDVFFEVTGYPLGDVAQHITIFEDNVFISINNSGKIYIVNKNSFVYVGEISGLNSPRFICIKNSLKGYITDLYSPIITIFNPTTYQKIGSINIGKSSEQIILADNFLYVTSWSQQNMVYKINSETDEIVDSLLVTFQPNSLVLDKQNNLWVLSDGGNYGSENRENAALTKINIHDFEIVQVFKFENIDNSPTRLCINNTKDTLYFLNGSWDNLNSNNSGVYKMPISATTLPQTAFIDEESKTFYGLAINPNNTDIYVSDALNYTKNGIIYRYSNSGMLIKKYEAGIIPGWIEFKN